MPVADLLLSGLTNHQPQVDTPSPTEWASFQYFIDVEAENDDDLEDKVFYTQNLESLRMEWQKGQPNKAKGSELMKITFAQRRIEIEGNNEHILT